jgi:hypothetical protein
MQHDDVSPFLSLFVLLISALWHDWYDQKKKQKLIVKQERLASMETKSWMQQNTSTHMHASMAFLSSKKAKKLSKLSYIKNTKKNTIASLATCPKMIVHHHTHITSSYRCDRRTVCLSKMLIGKWYVFL